MKSVLSLVLSVAVTALMSSSAAAESPLRGSLPYQEAETISSGKWSGIYGGLGALYGSFSHEDSADNRWSGSGLGINVHGGLMRQISSFVLGVEADLNYLGADYDHRPAGASSDRLDVLYSGRARVGYDMGIFQPYLTGGFGYAYGDEDGAEGAGWVFGAGVDLEISEHVMFGLQFQHHTYDEFGENSPVELDFNMALARVSAKF